MRQILYFNVMASTGSPEAEEVGSLDLNIDCDNQIPINLSGKKIPLISCYDLVPLYIELV